MQGGTGPNTGANGGGSDEQVALGIVRLGILFVNAYLVGELGGPSWSLVASGLPFSAALTRRAAAERYGAGTRPEAVVLTHGHFDHAGAALDLASEWDVPVYAHPLEMPYLTGRSDYPPQDPTMGGTIAEMARLANPRGRLAARSRSRPAPPIRAPTGSAGTGRNL
ncbi:MAG: MBL fold metallo-hydrolase [Actinomycetota bacterium]|nr:MBL fold metallo-hydrolase [Actinomycetota bacterium]